MPKIFEHTVKLETYSSVDELEEKDRVLVEAATAASLDAYAPYSQFYVGAALRLKNGEIIKGSNQENVAYPSGLCAERVAIYYAGATYPNQEIETLAVTAKTDNFEIKSPITPCGSCRQAIAEYEIKQQKPIRIIMSVTNGEVYICEGIKMLLPFMFNEQELKKE